MKSSDQDTLITDFNQGINFTSEFFGSFIDNSQIDNSQSDISEPSTPLVDFSVNQFKMKAFHMQNVISMWETITKRYYIGQWKKMKNSINFRDSITPQAITRTFLKLFYSLALKLQVKNSFAFRKIQKYAKENPIPATNFNHQSQNRALGIKQLQKIWLCLSQKHSDSNSKNQVFQILKGKSKISIFINTLESIWQCRKMQLYQQIWTKIKSWLMDHDKLQILAGTLHLMVHPLMRFAFWQLKKRKTSLQDNDISKIQQIQSHRRESFKMNQSAENLVQSIQSQKSLLENSKCSIEQRKVQQIEEPREDGVQKQRFFRKKQHSNEPIDRHHPINLKFSKDIKRKSVKSDNYSANDINDEEVQCQYNQKNQFPQTNDKQLTKQNIQLSMLQRGSMTLNTSIGQARSIIKKTSYPIQYVTFKACKITTILDENDLPEQLNGSLTKNKQFQNRNLATKAKQLRHQQIAKQFTDFNDLFNMRQVMLFYQSFDQSLQQQKKGISLAKLKQKFNIKTQEEYFDRYKSSQNKKQSHSIDRPLVTEPSINIVDQTNQISRRVIFREEENTINSVKTIGSVHSRQKSNSNISKSRKSQFRIPSQLPVNFDYYVDKSQKKQSKIQKSQKKISPLPIAIPQKKLSNSKIRNSSSKSSKKMFNVVKSGSNRLSTDRTKRNSDVDSYRSPQYRNSKVQPLNFQRSKQKIIKPENSHKNVVVSNNEYFMTFRDPPKKKMRKQIQNK